MLTWRNLYRQFLLAPGTGRPRIILSIWQAGLMLASGVGGALFGWYGVLAGFVGAWATHEVAFIWYAEKVAGLREMDRYAYAPPYTHPSYVPTIERWTGPFASDPKQEKVG